MAFPIGFVLWKIVLLNRASLTTMETGLFFMGAALVTGNLGYPFLRLDPLVASWGYNGTFIVIFVLSLLGPAVVLYKTERQRIESEIKEKKMRDLSHFITHEVKNALYAVSGTVKLIQKGTFETDEDTQEALTNILETSTKLYGASKRYLYYEKLQSQPDPLRFSEVPLGNITESAIRRVQFYSKENRVDLQNEISNDIILSGDAEKIETVMSNLLQNAVQASFEGGMVTITAVSKASGLYVTVQDRGRGMSAEKQSASQPSSLSTGLGLSICRRIMDLHGGEIFIESTLGLGTSVTLLFNKVQT